MYKKYDKILNKGFQLSDFVETGIEVTEKLDGSNASFTYDADAKKVRVFSRNQELTENNNLNGFYQYVQEFVKDFNDLQIATLSDYTIFGEWLTKHTVTYKDEAYNKFYAFDVFNKKSGYYVSRRLRLEVFSTLQLKTPEEFMTFEPAELLMLNKEDVLNAIKDSVGESSLTLTPDTGEGVVIKSLGVRDPDNDPSYKLVTDRFRETKGLKQQKPTGLQVHLVDYAITEARMKKIIFKKLDEQVLTEEDLTLQNFGKVMGSVAKEFQDDIIEEEMDEIIKQIRKRIGKQLPNLLRPFLEEKDRETGDL